MTGYSTEAEIRQKLSFFQPVNREPRTTSSAGKFTTINKPIADTDGDSSYLDEVTVIKAADESAVTITYVNNLTGEVTCTDCASTDILATYYYEKGSAHSGVVSTAIINTWNDDIKAYIDSRLTKTYTVPFSSPYPDEIQKLSSDMVSAKILMQLYPSTGSNEYSAAQIRWNMAEQYLTALELGTAKILNLNKRTRATSKFIDVDPIFTMSEKTYSYRSDPYDEDTDGEGST